MALPEREVGVLFREPIQRFSYLNLNAAAGRPTRRRRTVSEKKTNAPADANGKPAAGGGGAVIRRLEAAEETAQERLIKKHVPAWVVSGAIHVVVIALMIIFLGARD